jgi:hypothetical protein
MQKWKISRSRARMDVGWHIQARTEDQLSSFVVIAHEGTSIYRGKTADGKGDVFTLTDPGTMATMNVVGKIEYTDNWEDLS